MSVFSFCNTLFYLLCFKSHLGIWELDFFRFVFKFTFDKVGVDRLLEFLLNEDYYRGNTGGVGSKMSEGNS